MYLGNIESRTPIAWRGDRQRSALFVSTPGYTVLDPADWIQTFLCSSSTVDSVHVTTLRTEIPLAFACDLLVDRNSALVVRWKAGRGVGQALRVPIRGAEQAD